MQSAYNTEQASPQDGDIIAIPAGNCTWTTALTVSPTNSLTFQGAGAMTPAANCTFAPGSACTTTSGSDQTIITDGTSGGNIMLQVNIATGKTFRITGVEYYFPSSNTNTGTNGQWVFYGGNGTQQVRIDHNHFYGYAGHWMAIWGWLTGVADHNLVDLFLPDTNWINVLDAAMWNNDSSNLGNASWADYSYWGSNKAFFMENNVFPNDNSTNAVALNDCGNGGRQVFRYNTFQSPTNLIQSHEGQTDSQGCRTTEVYGNTSTPTGAGVLVGSRAGSVFAWGNVGSWAKIFTPSIDRTSNVNGNFNPTNLGLCGQGASGMATSSGSTVTWVSGRDGGGGFGQYEFQRNWQDESTRSMVFNGTSYPIASCSSSTTCTLTGLTGSNASPVPWYAPSVWDGNTDSTGYPCYDQPGRGKGDLITGSFSNGTRLNSATGTATWPSQQLDPSYIFANTNTYSGTCVSVGTFDTPLIQDNRDYYQQFGTGCEGGSFNGTAGVGQGLLSARPSTCTAGPGGNTPGVGYWATDQNTLYVCTATNNWTSYYRPYTYPHPLTHPSLTQGTGTQLAPPTNLAATVQ